MRVLVCGGRDFSRKDVLYKVLDEVNKNSPITAIISGMAKGADSLGWLYAKENDIEIFEFPADWKHHSNAAGHIRNQKMIDDGYPNLVVAFPTKNSIGTYDMIRRAEKHNIKIIIVKEDYN